MIPLCDDPRRLGARLYVALRVGCGCCTFFRGCALGMAIGMIAAGSAVSGFGAPIGAALIAAALCALALGAWLALSED